MRENDTAWIRPTDVPVALALMTRLPLPRLPDAAFDRQARAVWAFPLVGLIIGALAAAVGYLGLALGLPSMVVAGICLSTQIIVTGAMHEDGLADCADGFWGGWTPERRLDIMKDSHIGTYGVLALILSTGLRWVLLTVALDAGLWTLIAAAIASRAGLPLVMTMPRVRPGGLSDTVGAPPGLTVAFSCVLGLVGLILIAGAGTAPLVLAVLLALGLCAAQAQVKIGGQTGDVLGATQQITEIGALLALVATL